MDERTLAALRGSIEKWRAIEEGKIGDGRVGNCPLCQLFVVETRSCDGCPVEARTGCDDCRGSPYTAFALWDNARKKKQGISVFSVILLNPRVHTKGARLARAEREFLESLLPDGEKP